MELMFHYVMNHSLLVARFGQVDLCGADRSIIGQGKLLGPNVRVVDSNAESLRTREEYLVGWADHG